MPAAWPGWRTSRWPFCPSRDTSPGFKSRTQPPTSPLTPLLPPPRRLTHPPPPGPEALKDFQPETGPTAPRKANHQPPGTSENRPAHAPPISPLTACHHRRRCLPPTPSRPRTAPNPACSHPLGMALPSSRARDGSTSGNTAIIRSASSSIRSHQLLAAQTPPPRQPVEHPANPPELLLLLLLHP